MQHKLRIRGLRKTYGDVVALAGVDLDMKEGEFLTLLGASGSGKTTLLSIVAGLIGPDEGEVWIDDKLSTYLPPNKRDIGMVFQSYALFPHLTVAENIAFPLRMRRLKEGEIAEQIRKVLEIVQLPHVGERYPQQLSGGQQQRIALARCLVYRPSIILMDEPIGALDKKLREQMQLEIKHLHLQHGVTVLYVTHDQEEALVMSDRICLMRNGRIEQLGTPDELYFHPRTAYTADFLGEANLFDAAVAAVERDVARLSGPGGAVVHAPLRAPVQEGQQVRFMVRPENLRILEPGKTARNTLGGTVREVLLVGPVTRYYVTLDGGSTLLVVGLTDIGAKNGILPGAKVRLGWSVETTVLLADRPGEAPS